MNDHYDDDILLWSERQADLLRRVAAGERVNNQLDWENIVEEIEDVGRSSLRACRSHLLQMLLHRLKAEAWPQSRDVPHWLSEAKVALINAQDAYAPSMRQHIDLADLYAKALSALPEAVDGVRPQPVPQTCQVMLEELLSGKV